MYKALTFSNPDNGADPPQTPAAIHSRYMNLALEWQTLCEALYRHHRFGNSSQQPYEVGTIFSPVLQIRNLSTQLLTEQLKDTLAQGHKAKVSGRARI